MGDIFYGYDLGSIATKFEFLYEFSSIIRSDGISNTLLINDRKTLTENRIYEKVHSFAKRRRVFAVGAKSTLTDVFE